MPEAQPLFFTLNPDGVTAPALKAVEHSVEVVSFFMLSLDKADLSRAPAFDTARIQMRFESSIDATERRMRYTNWILSKGFQDLARGIRATLEEAYLYVRMIAFPAQWGGQKIPLNFVHEEMDRYRKEAGSMPFPELMRQIRNGLTSPLNFEKEFLSLQQVRNCLEHRDGIVGERDVDKDTKLLNLFLPQLKMYVEKNGGQTEIGKGSIVEGGKPIILRNEIQRRQFKLGDRITFNPEEFHDIGFGCFAFVQDLRAKLPLEINTETNGKKSRVEGPKKLKPRLPRGLADHTPGETAATRQMIEKIRAVYELYGFEAVETPAIEYTDALGKFLPDQDRPNEGVFSFLDDDEQWLSLRYDLTAPLARYVAENFDTLPKPYRSYRVGNVFRNEKPGPGRFRQFMQFDADTVGSSSPAADAELLMMAADTMEALGIPRGSYVVKVNSRKVLDAVLETIGLHDEASSGKRLIVLRAIDKLDRLGVDGVRELLGKGRRDESGDFTKGAELSEEQIFQVFVHMIGRSSWTPIDSDTVLPTDDELIVPKEFVFPDWRTTVIPNLVEEYFFNNQNLINGWSGEFLDTRSGGEAHAELQGIFDSVRACGFGSNRIRVSLDVVRGLEYYTGPVFEVDLTFPISGDDGKPIRFGSVGAGGRYDGLVSRFRGEPVPATGFSIGVSRLLAALEYLGKVDLKTERGPVVVTVFDRDRIADYQAMVAKLRHAGIRAELYLGSGKFGPQMKYADRRNSPCVVIQGSDEKAKGEVTVKDLIVGAELAKLEKGREEHLQKQAEAQRAVPEDKLVDAVRAVLARHGLA